MPTNLVHPSFLLLSLVLGSCAVQIEAPEQPLDGIGLAPARQDPRQIDDQAIAAAFQKREQLKWPARLAVARFGQTERGRGQSVTTLANVPTREQEIIDARFEKGERWKPLVYLSPLVASEGSFSLLQMRLEAARAHADLLLVYGITTREGSAPNPLALLNVALLPAFVLPGSDLETLCVGGMALVDVRNGCVYALAGMDERRGKSAPSASKGGTYDALFHETSHAVVAKLLDRVAAQVQVQEAQGTR
jgi:hypothetical protein